MGEAAQHRDEKQMRDLVLPEVFLEVCQRIRLLRFRACRENTGATLTAFERPGGRSQELLMTMTVCRFTTGFSAGSIKLTGNDSKKSPWSRSVKRFGVPTSQLKSGLSRRSAMSDSR